MRITLALLLACALLWPSTALAIEKPFLIGVLTTSWGPGPTVVSLRTGLQSLGYREYEDFVIGVRFTSGNSNALDHAALDLVREGADLLWADGDTASLAAQRATNRIPIVVGVAADPVQLGLVKSFARPGGNITGFADRSNALGGKRLQLLHELVPGLRKVLFVHETGNNPDRLMAEVYRKAAARLAITLVVRPVNSGREAYGAVTGLKNRKIDAVISPWDVGLNIPGIIIEEGKRQKVPTMFSFTFMTESGGLASYGPSSEETGRRAAHLVDKIMKGADPGRIPMEVISAMEFTINLKTAKALGIEIPPEVLFQATRIVR